MNNAPSNKHVGLVHGPTSKEALTAIKDNNHIENDNNLCASIIH